MPQPGHKVSSLSPHELHVFQSFCTGLEHFGHLDGPTGLTFPQKGHALESGGLRRLQYLQGRLKVGTATHNLREFVQPFEGSQQGCTGTWENGSSLFASISAEKKMGKSKSGSPKSHPSQILFCRSRLQFRSTQPLLPARLLGILELPECLSR